jgi:manganese/zinc/iron transport system permease protein
MPFKELIEFFTFSEPNVRLVFWGALVLCSIAAMVGCFTYLRKRSLMGDVIAHSVLPGICLAFLVARQKDPAYLLIGASITGWIAVWLVDFITKHSKIKSDTAIALILSVFFGAGVLLLTHIQHTGMSSQSGLDSFIFGKAASMQQNEVNLFTIIAIIVSAVIFFFKRGFYVLSFDEDFARAVGFPVPLLKVILSAITVLVVAAGVQAVGVVLMASLLITPAATARFWTNRLSVLIFIAVFVGAFSGVIGSAISFTYSGMPTGPWIVVVMSLMAFTSALISPQRGMLYRWYRKRKQNRKIITENVLKRFFYLPQEEKSHTKATILGERSITPSDFNLGINKLIRSNLVKKEGANYSLTSVGIIAANEIVRKHRLWEMYLSRYFNLKEDHLHDDAEGIEHIITPEILKELEEILDRPEKDPHNKEIPY